MRMINKREIKTSSNPIITKMLKTNKNIMVVLPIKFKIKVANLNQI